MTDTTERAAFEAWGGQHSYLMQSDYKCMAWEAWQARAALSTPPAAVRQSAYDAYAARYKADPADPSQAEQVATYTDGWYDAMAAQPVTPCHQSDAIPTPCAGSNCGTTTARHSRECIAEHAAAVASGKFVKEQPNDE